MSIARPASRFLPQLHSILGITYVRMTRFLDSTREIRVLPGGPIWMMMITMMMMKMMVMEMVMEIAIVTDGKYVHLSLNPEARCVELSCVYGVNDTLATIRDTASERGEKKERYTK